MFLDIRHVYDRRELLHALWRQASVIAQRQPFDMAVALRACGDDGYADYVCGRAIKANVFIDNPCISGYDRDNGAGAFQRVVEHEHARQEALRRTGLDVDNESSQIPAYGAVLDLAMERCPRFL